MKRKILTFVLSFALLLCLCVTAFAFEIPSEYEGTKYGAHYDTSHDDECICQQVGSGGYNHYEAGYQAGFGDGLASNGVSDDEKQQVIDDYLASEAFEAVKQQIIAEYKESAGAEADKQEAIEEYKNSAEYNAALLNSYNSGYSAGEEGFKSSDEYTSSLEKQYLNGMNAAYDSAYNAAYQEAVNTVYDKGVADGYSNFRGTAEYKNTLQAQFDGGYNKGYEEATADMDAVEEAPNTDWSSIISIFATIGMLLVVLVLVSIRKRKNNKGFKKGKM